MKHRMIMTFIFNVPGAFACIVFLAFILFAMKYKKKDLVIGGQMAANVMGIAMPFVNVVMWGFIAVLLIIKYWNLWQ